MDEFLRRIFGGIRDRYLNDLRWAELFATLGPFAALAWHVVEASRIPATHQPYVVALACLYVAYAYVRNPKMLSWAAKDTPADAAA